MAKILRKRVAILGACVTRDNFNSRLNPAYKDRYQVDLLQNQSSIISIMSPPRCFDPSWISDQDEWSQWCVRSDINKEFVEKLGTTNPDIVIVDLFADARFGVIMYDGSFITHNDWRLPQSGLYRHLDPNTRMRAGVQKSEYLAFFSDAVTKLDEVFRNAAPQATIVLNSARTVNDCIRSDGTRYRKFDDGWMNANWELLDAAFIEAVPRAIVISGHTDGAASHDDHIWKSASFHYETDVYHQFLKKLDAALSDNRAP